jgi:hypothetical protein
MDVKYVCVQDAKYVSGSNNETRNDISIYHPEMQSGNNSKPVMQADFPELYTSYPTFPAHTHNSNVKFVPKQDVVVTVAIVVDAYTENIGQVVTYIVFILLYIALV